MVHKNEDKSPLESGNYEKYLEIDSSMIREMFSVIFPLKLRLSLIVL